MSITIAGITFDDWEYDARGGRALPQRGAAARARADPGDAKKDTRSTTTNLGP
jgi:hypothetical protein